MLPTQHGAAPHECAPPDTLPGFLWLCPCGRAWRWSRYGPDGDIRIRWARIEQRDDWALRAAWDAEKQLRGVPWWRWRDRFRLRREAESHRAFSRSLAAL